MDIAYKEDWHEMQERMRAWWAGETLERPLLQVTAPRRATSTAPTWNSWTLVHSLDNPERAVDQFEGYCRGTFFGGEAFPNLWINLGPGITAAYLGRTPQIAEDTVWFEAGEPFPWPKILELKLDPANKWWRLTRDLTALATEKGAGKFFVSVTDLNGVLNILGSLRGTQQLLIDCVDSPDLVKKASSIITDIWLACYDALIEITQRRQEGSSSWMGIWFPGRGSDVQCDFAAMISPRMFEEFVLPDLRRQCLHLEQSIFHLDGPGQIPHLELLLEIPELGGIQWVPGAGNPDVGSPRWFPLYKRIQAKGKRLVLQGMDPADVPRVVAELGPKGLLISTRCESEDEARELLALSSKWAKKSRS